MSQIKVTHFKSPNINLSEIGHERFYENDELLITEEGKDFTKNDFTARVKEELSKFVNRSFDNIIVLAGAGSSVVTNNGAIDQNYGKTVGMIAENIAVALGDITPHPESKKMEENATATPNESSDLYTLKELAAMSNYNVDVEIDNEFNPKFNLENFLSNLLTYEQFLKGSEADKAKFTKSKEKILELIIKNTSYEYSDEKMNHSKLLNILADKVKNENKLTVVTTNYDTLFEDAAEKLEMTVIDGFSFSYSPSFDSDMFDWNLVRNVPNVKTKQLEYKKNVINLLKIHGSLTWERSKENERILRKPKQSVDNPIMVFPSSNKYAQSYEQPYFELFTKFQEFLRKPNTLFITTGFSFADNHITSMIIQAIKHNTGLNVLVTDFSIDQEHENWIKLDQLRKDNFQIAFLKATLNDNLTDYIGGYK